MTPTAKTVKLINSLKNKKYRRQHKLFVVEGEKMVGELLKSHFSIHSIYSTKGWLERNKELINTHSFKKPIIITDRNYHKYESKPALPHFFLIHQVNDGELSRMSGLTSANKVVALVNTPVFRPDMNVIKNSLTVVLDNIQDPGNLGTMIRSAEWFGVKNIVLSKNSADITNPKVVQATMGSLFRINFHYCDLDYFFELPELEGIPVYGAFLGGTSIYTLKLSTRGLIILGNESQGISQKLLEYVTQKISIPPFYKKVNSAESLNIAVAGSIILSEFRRRET